MQTVLTAAGLGTRLLPFTKEIPKEMLPIPIGDELKPLIQVIFEQLYDQGISDYIFVVSRNKRVIEDYFTPDYEFVDLLKRKGKETNANSLRSFYEKVERSNISFVNQHEPKGFGDAVLRAEPYVTDDFFVVAPDTLVFDLDIKKMPINSFLVTEVKDPRPYGVVVVDSEMRVIDVEEKPEKPKSNVIILPYYHFDRRIFRALKNINCTGELQLTEGIRTLIWDGVEFKVIRVNKTYDLGNFEGYITFHSTLMRV